MNVRIAQSGKHDGADHQSEQRHRRLLQIDQHQHDQAEFECQVAGIRPGAAGQGVQHPPADDDAESH
jgi:hypothetical protein